VVLCDTRMFSAGRYPVRFADSRWANLVVIQDSLGPGSSSLACLFLLVGYKCNLAPGSEAAVTVSARSQNRQRGNAAACTPIVLRMFWNPGGFEPVGNCGHKMTHEAGMTQPGAHIGMLVNAVVVHNQMERNPSRKRLIQTS
jgi:hypothetical protein